MNLLPQVSTEDLDEGDLEGGDLAMHEYSRQVKLHLEANVDACTVDRGTPPEGEATIGDLVETGTLCIGESS